MKGDDDSIDRNTVVPNYFQTMRIPLKRGRSFSDADRDTSEPVAILNEAAVKKYFPEQDALASGSSSATKNGLSSASSPTFVSSARVAGSTRRLLAVYAGRHHRHEPDHAKPPDGRCLAAQRERVSVTVRGPAERRPHLPRGACRSWPGRTRRQCHPCPSRFQSDPLVALRAD